MSQTRTRGSGFTQKHWRTPALTVIRALKYQANAPIGEVDGIDGALSSIELFLMLAIDGERTYWGGVSFGEVNPKAVTAWHIVLLAFALKKWRGDILQRLHKNLSLLRQLRALKSIVGPLRERQRLRSLLESIVTQAEALG